MPYPKKKPGKDKVHKGGWFKTLCGVPPTHYQLLKALLERATQLLGSSRITAEANALLTGLKRQFLDTLLKL